MARRKKSVHAVEFPIIGFLNDKKKTALEQRLGVSISNVAIYEQALVHRSLLPQMQGKAMSNERLEFLGDSILGMVVAEYLFYHFRDNMEGELTKMRSWLVNKRSLAICARSLRLEDFIQVSFSANQSLLKGNETILADALEAVIAAVYLDSGIQTVRKFILRTLIPILNESPLQDANYKSKFLELVQAQGQESPKYVVLEEVGPAHERTFTVAVTVGGVQFGVGVGKSKKDAEQLAAKNALDAHYPQGNG